MAANSGEMGEKAAAARFRWDKEDKVHNRIKCLASYKVVCMYEGKDFNADKPKLYEVLREEMARIYQDEPTMPAKSLGTPPLILPCFAISPSPPWNNVVLWSEIRDVRTIHDSAGMLGQ